MIVAINIIPLKTAHSERGIGYYTKNLVEALKEDSSIQLKGFGSPAEVKDVDVIHYPWFDFFFHSLPIRKTAPTIVTIHDVIPLIFPDQYPTGWKAKINFMLQKLALKNCQFIITDSNFSKKDIVTYLKIKEEKIAVIPLAADPKFKLQSDTELLRIKRKYRLPDQYLLYVGDANWIKNLPFLIEGFNKLIKLSGMEKVKLVLIGGVFLKDVENIDHPELQSLKQVNKLIAQFKLQGQILRPGQIEDVELVAFYNLATIYVQPSFYEGFGLPVLQAFASGTPVVSSSGGSLPEIGGQAAVYFDPTNLKQFVSIVREVLENKSLRRKLSKSGLNQAAKFSWDKVAEQTKIVYLKSSQK